MEEEEEEVDIETEEVGGHEAVRAPVLLLGLLGQDLVPQAILQDLDLIHQKSEIDPSPPAQTPRKFVEDLVLSHAHALVLVKSKCKYLR